jgi:hypothetical protein
VLQQGRILAVDLATLERSHEYDAASRTVAFISGDQIGGTCGEAEAAMHAGVERLIAGQGGSGAAGQSVARMPELLGHQVLP